MSIRLNKAIKEFGVGLQTLSDFLKKKGFPITGELNQKLDDNQYDLLKKEFGADRDIRMKAEELRQNRQVKKHSEQKSAKLEDEMSKQAGEEEHIATPETNKHSEAEAMNNNEKQPATSSNASEALEGASTKAGGREVKAEATPASAESTNIAHAHQQVATEKSAEHKAVTTSQTADVAAKSTKRTSLG